jgi:branched-chain amino acid transport system substrate-binding protein
MAVMASVWSRIVIGLALAFQLGCALAADTVKIAFIGGLSGTFALQGEEQLTVFNAAADMVNSRGGVLGGRKIEIVAFDNKANPQDSLIVLKQVTDQDIRYVASTISSVAHAISDALSKYNARNPDRPVLLFNFNALDPALTEAKCNFWHFRFEPHTDMQVNALTDTMAKQQGLHKVYLINQDYAYGQSVAHAAKQMLTAKRADIQVVGDDLIPLGKVKDFSPYVAKIRASGADAVLTGNWGNDLSLLIKASNEAGLKATYYTLFGAFFGTPAAIGSAGADRVKTVWSWHINAADPAWEKRLLDYGAKYKAVSDVAYIPPFRVVEMLANAMNSVGSADPLKVAHALEGMKYAGPTGESWMRAEDHQMIAPLYVMSFVKAGQPGVKHDAEGTGFGWKTDVLIQAKDTAPQIKCAMQRP